MKHLILALSLLASNLNAIEYRVDDKTCGNISHSLESEACVLDLSHLNIRKRILVMSQSDLKSIYTNIQIGDFVEIENSSLNEITNEEVIQVLNFEDFNNPISSYFYNEFSIQKINLNSDNKNIFCEAKKEYVNGMDVNFQMGGEVNLFENGYINIRNLNIKTDIIHSNFYDSYSKASFYKNTVVNKMDYKPTKYKNHAKFNLYYDLGPEQYNAFGELDIILPLDQLHTKSQTKTFKAFLIMTAIEDHWGGTIDMECKLVNKR